MCEHEGCKNKDVYCVEWWGLNQFGKDPEIVHEVYSCANPKHLIALSGPEEYDGSLPDNIYNVNTDKGKPRLLAIVTNALEGKLDHQTKRAIDHLTSIVNSPKGQPTLFPVIDNYLMQTAKALGFEVECLSS
jgi:hypothetical protein